MPEIIRLSSSGIKCDAHGCGFQAPGIQRHDFRYLVDMPCPRCDANLLTQADYDALLRLERSARIINRLFGWLAWFCPHKWVDARFQSDGSGKITCVFPAPSAGGAP